MANAQTKNQQVQGWVAGHRLAIIFPDGSVSMGCPGHEDDIRDEFHRVGPCSDPPALARVEISVIEIVNDGARPPAHLITMALIKSGHVRDSAYTQVSRLVERLLTPKEPT